LIAEEGVGFEKLKFFWQLFILGFEPINPLNMPMIQLFIFRSERQFTMLTKQNTHDHGFMWLDSVRCKLWSLFLKA